MRTRMALQVLAGWVERTECKGNVRGGESTGGGGGGDRSESDATVCVPACACWSFAGQTNLAPPRSWSTSDVNVWERITAFLSVSQSFTVMAECREGGRRAREREQTSE